MGLASGEDLLRIHELTGKVNGILLADEISPDKLREERGVFGI